MNTKLALCWKPSGLGWLRAAALALATFAIGWHAFAGPSGAYNGFAVGNATIPLSAIESGGPPRDGIPAIDAPRFVAATAATHMRDDDRVLGVVVGGLARAYPVGILNWHEVVNDRFGTTGVSVTYCPLCGTGVAFLRQVGTRELAFGVSGLLYNSDVLLYDRETESLWSQIGSRAVAGPLAGQALTRLPTAHTSWREWRTRHPTTQVLSDATGHRRDYRRDPYAGYGASADIWFAVSQQSDRLHPKAWVLGVELGGLSKAYPFDALAAAGGQLTDRLAGQVLHIDYDAGARSARVTLDDGREPPAIAAFWFAWYAFHPDTGLYAR